jgi:hypothetical protein
MNARALARARLRARWSAARRCARFIAELSLRLLLPLLLAACATALPSGGAGPAASGSKDGSVAAGPAAVPEREILVMIRTDIRNRFQPGSSGLAEYGVAPERGVRQTAESIARDYRLVMLNDWPMPSLGMHCFLMQLGAGTDISPTLAGLNGDRRIEWAQPSQQYRLLEHNDPYYPLQAAARSLRLDDAHQISTGKGVLIAEIDTGIDLRHPDLDGQVRRAENFVDGSAYAPEIHGTAVAGIIAGRADNGIGIVGVAPAASLLGLRACREAPGGAGASCDTFSLAKALQFALRSDANIVNMSLSGPYDRLLAALIDKVLARDTVVVVAADPDHPDGGFPASHRGVIAAAAEGTAASAPQSAVLAPGTDILTTAPPAGWAYFSGASMAAAHVTGVVALVLAGKPGISEAMVARALAVPAAHGEELLDACAVLRAATVLRTTDGERCACCGPVASGVAIPVSHRGPGASP